MKQKTIYVFVKVTRENYLRFVESLQNMEILRKSLPKNEKF